ncbi:MAG: hypothetical protein JNJ72_20160, partial [Anaerolineales bacterium]|nr:hypothetical protein [Anaerolineales bacterium]
NFFWGEQNPAANVLIGGVGNDTYTVGIGDTVIELPGEGTNDRVFSQVDFTLPDNVEFLSLVTTGSIAVRGTGNDLGNTLTGNTLANLLQGLAGNDTLTGGAGNDTLDGGQGIDTAVFSGAATEWVVSRTGDNAYTVTHGSGEVDSLTDVEFVQFNGPISIALSTGGVAVSSSAPTQGQALGVTSTLANGQSLTITGYQWQSSNGLNGWSDIPGATQAN